VQKNAADIHSRLSIIRKANLLESHHHLDGSDVALPLAKVDYNVEFCTCVH